MELYRKANRNTDAALLLQEIATDLVKKEVNNCKDVNDFTLGRSFDNKKIVCDGSN